MFRSSQLPSKGGCLDSRFALSAGAAIKLCIWLLGMGAPYFDTPVILWAPVDTPVILRDIGQHMEVLAIHLGLPMQLFAVQTDACGWQ